MAADRNSREVIHPTPMVSALTVAPGNTADARLNKRLLTLHEALAAPPGTVMAGCALVLRCEPATDRRGQPYLQLTLRTADAGRLEARWWRYPYPLTRRPVTGQVCWFEVTCEEYAGERQLRIHNGRPTDDVGVELFTASTRRTERELRQELARVLAGLDPDLRTLADAVLVGETLERFCIWPAAQMRHGACRHGLLAHSLRVVAIAQRLIDAYAPHGLPCDYGVVRLAALLHDVGKVFTLPTVAGAVPPPDAARWDHVTRGVLLLQQAADRACLALSSARFECVLHAVLAHHGRKEWGAPIEPQTVEAWVVHLADLAESRLWAWSVEEAPAQ